ncbi:MAG: hypothetical protein U1C18_02440, partial [Patescibacteria group bacterium]|nr:hypothetical protein [Patescibacteria group bacterium]
KEDFESAHAGEKDLLDVLDDLLQHAPESRAICIAYPSAEGFHAVVHTHDPSLDLRRALGRLGAFGSRNLVSCSISARNGDEAIFAIKSLLTH